MSNNIDITDLERELGAIYAEYQQTAFDARQEALQAGAEVLVDALEQNAPRGESGGLAGSFKVKYAARGGGKGKYKYKDRRYVGSTKTVSGKAADGTYKDNIPLVNIIEYGANGEKTKRTPQPFVRQTFDANQSKIFEAIKSKLK